MRWTRSGVAGISAAAMLLTIPFMARVGEVRAKSQYEPGSLTADEILAKCDDFHFGYKDAKRQIKTILKDKDGNKSELKYKVWEKGVKRLIIFDAPGEVAGMAVLTKDEDTIYVYEPEFNKVRRVAAHAKKQTMMGMDITADETATKHFAKSYDPKIVSEDSERVILLLEQKPDKDKAFPKLKLYIEKKPHWAAMKIESLDEKGKKKKTEKRKKIKDFNGRMVPSILIYTDHDKKHSTTLIVQSADHDIGLSDKMFTKRYLIREE